MESSKSNRYISPEEFASLLRDLPKLKVWLRKHPHVVNFHKEFLARDPSRKEFVEVLAKTLARPGAPPQEPFKYLEKQTYKVYTVYHEARKPVADRLLKQGARRGKDRQIFSAGTKDTAWMLIYDLYRPISDRSCKAFRLNNEAVQDDIYSTSITRLYKYCVNGNNEIKGHPLAYFTRITKNVCLDRLKKDKRHDLQSLEEMLQNTHGVPESIRASASQLGQLATRLPRWFDGFDEVEQKIIEGLILLPPQEYIDEDRAKLLDMERSKYCKKKNTLKKKVYDLLGVALPSRKPTPQ